MQVTVTSNITRKLSVNLMKQSFTATHGQGYIFVGKILKKMLIESKEIFRFSEIHQEFLKCCLWNEGEFQDVGPKNCVQGLKEIK